MQRRIGLVARLVFYKRMPRLLPLVVTLIFTANVFQAMTMALGCMATSLLPEADLLVCMAKHLEDLILPLFLEASLLSQLLP